MTLAEFKAWFEGFTEDMDGAPNAKQWKRIKDRVKQIDGVALTATTIYHHWPIVHQRPLYYGTGTTVYGNTYAAGASGLAQGNLSQANYMNSAAAAQAQCNNAAINVVDLGRADYAELKAA